MLDEAHAFMDLESNQLSGKMMVNLLETMAAEMRAGIGSDCGGSAAVPVGRRIIAFLHKYLHAYLQSGEAALMGADAIWTREGCRV